MMSRHTLTRTKAPIVVVGLLGSVAFGLVACADDGPIEPVDEVSASEPPDGLVISEPIAGRTASSRLGTSAVEGSSVVYVSASPGTFEGTTSVDIRNVTAVDPTVVSIPILEGGFDPVAVPAGAGDELELTVQTEDAQLIVLVLRVVADRPPVVVRTYPPRGRTDVALSVLPMVIFSEPIDPSTLTDASLQLRRDGAAIAAAVGLDEESPFIARLRPEALLEPSTTYELVASTAIHDLEGDALAEDLSATFTTSGITPTLSIVSGDGQTGRVGTALADSFVVRVSDAGGGPLQNVRVLWQSDQGAVGGFAADGSPIDTLTTLTDADGLARASLVPTVFWQGTTRARLESSAGGTCCSDRVEFTTDSRDPGATLSVVSGDNQPVDAGQPSAPLLVRMTDGQGNPVQHVGVSWQRTFGEGTFSPCAVVGCKAAWAEAWTDVDGFAQVSFVPLWFGLVGIEARLQGAPGPSVFFEIDASDPGASIEIASGDGQVGKANEKLAEPLVVRVTNGRGEPVERVRVSGFGPLVDGLASVDWTPRWVGTVSLWAELPGIPSRDVRFTAEATAFVIEVFESEGVPGWIPAGTYFYSNMASPDCITASCLATNQVEVGWPLEWVIRVPSARIVSTSVPPGGTAFGSGTLAEGGRFTFVPNVAGTWEYVDQVSGALGVLNVY